MTTEDATVRPCWKLRHDLPGFQVLNEQGRAVGEFWLGDDANTAIEAVNSHDRLTEIAKVAAHAVEAFYGGDKEAVAEAMGDLAATLSQDQEQKNG